VTWTLTYGAVSVSLPTVASVVDDGGANAEFFEQDEDQPYVMLKSLREQNITLQGSIYVAGQTDAQLETNYLSKIRGLKGQFVTVTSTDSQFDGVWMLVNYNFRRVPEGTLVRWQYVLTLSRGS
jgi:hypothetical protein